MPTIPPLHDYSTRLTERQSLVAARERTHVHLGNAKVAIFLGAIVYGAVTIDGNPRLSVYVVGGAAYLALWVWHELTIRALTRAQAAVRFYRDGIARIEDRWIGTGPTGERFRDRDHPYADDLDVFGHGSLFQLLTAARTPMGEERLAAWLKTAASPSHIQLRQARVSALAPNVDLRERIAVVNAGARRRIAADLLIAWAGSAPTLPPVRVLVVALAVLFAAALVYFLRGGGVMPMGVIVVAQLAVWPWLGKRANAVVESLSAATEAAGLELLWKVIHEIEAERVTDPDLAALFATLTTRGAPPVRASRAIARLARISDWADSRHNVFARVLEVPALFSIQVAYSADAWRKRHGLHLKAWIDVVGEVEALMSLSGYSFEHPADRFPEIVESPVGEAFFDGVDLGHPLIPAATAVKNTVGLGLGTKDLGPSSRLQPEPSSPKPQAPSQTRVLIVSGSNMSGKSTLLRTVGLNVVMAFAGAPVRAASLIVSPLALGTCLRHTDSLHEGRSGFFTEVLRIRLVSDLIDGPRPVLFLFDELLSGTNSKDRRIAAEGLVRLMVNRRALGMVTTHDLALTEIAEVFPGLVRNVHLQDHVEDGQMRFDYKLRDGVIQHSNALALMRMIGLDV